MTSNTAQNEYTYNNIMILTIPTNLQKKIKIKIKKHNLPK